MISHCAEERVRLHKLCKTALSPRPTGSPKPPRLTRPATIHSMPILQRLRHANLLARFMLVWFAMSVAVAVVSPWVSPQSTELICSGSGVMKMLVKNADGSSTEVASPMLDCPLCATVSAPPPAAQTVALPAQPLGHALQPIPAAHIAARTNAPPPARGPPTFS